MIKPKHRPPALANLILKYFCRKDYLEEVRGDLEEVFEWRLNSKGPFKAKWGYFLDALSSIRFVKTFKKSQAHKSSNIMLFSLIKSALRNFRRHLSYTLLNVMGLAIGMMAALFILEYVSDELEYDQFSQSDDMYRVDQNFIRNGEEVYKTAVTAAPLMEKMLSDLPKVEKAARLFDYTRTWAGRNVFTLPGNPTKSFEEPNAFFADPAIIDLFDLEVVSGNSKLNEPKTALLSIEAAKKYFGGAGAAIGKLIRFSSARDKPELVVTGVFNYPEFNIQVRPDILVSYISLEAEVGREGLYKNWGVNSCLTYVKLQDGSDPEAFKEDLAALLLRYNPLPTDEEKKSFRLGSFFVTPIQDLHLNSIYQDEVGPVGDAAAIKVLIIIAIFIVVMAWINYINLTTAHSINRAKEVAVRKVIGAKKNQLVIQFFTEAFLINLFAMVLAIGCVIVSQSFFDQFVNRSLTLESIDFNRFGVPMLALFVAGTLLSGLYPALVLSSHKVLSTLKGRATGNSGLTLRRGLIVFQLLFSSLLIMATLSIRQQLSFMNNEEKGLNMENVWVLDGPTIKDTDRDRHNQKVRLFTDRLESLPSVLSAGVSNSIPGKAILQSQTLSKENNIESERKNYELVSGDAFLDILEMKLVAGEKFSGEAGSMEERAVILSVSAARQLGFANVHEAIGESIHRWYHGETSSPAVIVGVVADYHHESMNRPIDPMIFYAGNTWDYHYLIKFKDKGSSDAFAEIGKIYSDVFPGNPTNYYALGDFFDRQYQSEEINSKVFTGFALLAMIVACFGLYGLSSFTALQRTKEIGIRKVLGARVKSVFYLLSLELMLLTTAGFLLAVPIGYYGIKRWLDGFAYHISISWLLFLVPLLIILTVSFLSVSYRVVKTALINPVESLRYE